MFLFSYHEFPFIDFILGAAGILGIGFVQQVRNYSFNFVFKAWLYSIQYAAMTKDKASADADRMTF